jgi:uracil-DNA glycosylase
VIEEWEKHSLFYRGFDACVAKYTNPNSLGSDTPEINSERMVATLRQHIWEHWNHGIGQCGECPIRCEKSRFDPLYGLFNYDADVMFVAEEPGTFDEFSERDGGKGRIYRTMPDEEVDRLGDVLPHPHLVEERGYDYKGSNEWDNLMEGARRLTDASKYTNGATGRPTIGYSLEEIYYTNSLKCSRLADSAKDVDDPDKRNNTARGQCRPYLEAELTYVNPRVVVTFGTNAWEQTIKALGIADQANSLSSLKTNLNNNPESAFGVFGDNPKVIPSYHWSNLGQMKQHIDFINEESEYRMYDHYFAELARTVTKHL